jgi:hypothetical protein
VAGSDPPAAPLLSPGTNVKFVRPYLRYDLESAVELLVGERKEQFEFERAIRLMEFQTWIYWPEMNTNMPNIAGLMAAVLLLENIEDDIYFEEAPLAQQFKDPDEQPFIDFNDKPNATLGRINALRSNQTYKGVYDRLFADRGSLEVLLYCPAPPQFDADLENRRDKARIVADLIDYRLRHAQHGSAYPGYGANRHAVFFEWWPTYDVKGRRGITVEGKSASPKTLFSRAREFQITSIFIYLNENRDYGYVPEFGDYDGGFLKPLLAAAQDVDQLRRFFGTYAYIAEIIEAAGGEHPAVSVPPTVPRIEIETLPFTASELQVIADYSQNAVLMDK